MEAWKHDTQWIRVGGSLLAGGLIATGCGGSSESKSTVTVTASSTATSAASSSSAAATSTAAPSTTGAAVDLQSLIPTPAGAQRTDGPSQDDQNGIRMHFVVAGAPMEVMEAYKKALEAKGWILSDRSSGGGGGGGGATYGGTNGGAFGLFGGGGYGGITDVNSCAWPAEPTDIHCG